MKPPLTQLTKIIVTTILTGIIGTWFISAAETAPTPRQRGPVDQGDRSGWMRLDDRQRSLLQEAFQSHQDEFRKLEEQMRTAQKDLVIAMIAVSPKESEIREKAEAVAKIEVELTVLRAKVVAEVMPSLTAEQREQLQNNPMAIAMLTRFGMRPPGGRGGLGGGRGQAPDRGNPGAGRGPGGDRPPQGR